MAIVEMKKFSLMTFEAYKKDLLKELQKFGDIHFKNLQKDDLTDLKFLNKDISLEAVNAQEGEFAKIQFAMNKLEPYVSKPKGLKAMTTPLPLLDFDSFDHYLDSYDYHKVFQAIKKEDDEINLIKTEISRLKAENDSLRTWLNLDVSRKELEQFKFTKYLIGTISKVSAENFRIQAEDTYPAMYLEFIGNIKDDVIVLMLMPSEEYEEAFAYFKTLGFSKLEFTFSQVPSDIVITNEVSIVKLQENRTEAENKIKALSTEYDKLQVASDYYATLLERERACQNFLKTQSIVVIEGWVPEAESDQLKGMITKVCKEDFYLEETAVEKDSEEVPIKLKNNKFIAAFEDVTEMFGMPKYNEIDPTPFLTPFYMLFFGFMLGDAGYGLILLIGTAIALKFFALKDGTRKFLQFFFYLSFPTIFAGFIYGSLFGFPFFTPILTSDGTYKAILDCQSDVMPMMILSIAIGVIQILYGIGIKGYMLIRDGKYLDAVFDSLFWIITLVSAIGLLLGAMNIVSGTLMTVSKWGFILSIIGLALTQGRESESLGGKIGSGLYAVYGLSSYVGDFVSYTRLAALALSGAYISFSFNLMAELIPAGFFRILFGSLVFVFGQLLNLGLSALGAYVHTCRLQYVEFFGKFYEGGGVPFQAFQLKNKFINIKK